MNKSYLTKEFSTVSIADHFLLLKNQRIHNPRKRPQTFFHTLIRSTEVCGRCHHTNMNNIGHRVLICGDRNWNDFDSIRDVIQELKLKEGIQCIIEGEASGADSFARVAGESLGIPVLKYPANWKEYGRGAGHIRNQQMLDEGKPTLVLAFHNNIRNSKGTRDMILKSLKKDIKTILYSQKLESIILSPAFIL